MTLTTAPLETASRPLVTPAPALVIRRPPPWEPPYDDDRAAGAALVAGGQDRPLPFDDFAADDFADHFATDHLAPDHLATDHFAADDFRTDDFRAGHFAADDVPAGPGWVTNTRSLPDPRWWAGRLVQAAAEVLGGRRPIQQLMPWTSERVYADLARRLRRRSGPLKGPAAARVRSVRVSQPRPGVAEVAAVLTQGGRGRAVALRLEGVDGRWRCVVLQVC